MKQIFVVLAIMWLPVSVFGYDASIKTIHVFAGHTDKVRALAFSPDGQYLLSGSYDYTMKLWDTTGECLRTFSGHTAEVQTVAYSPDGKYVLSGSLDKTVKLWDVATGKCIQTYYGSDDAILSVAFSSDGKYFVSGSRAKTIKLYSIKNGNCLTTFEGHTGYVFSVSFCDHDRKLLSGSSDGSLKLWDIKAKRGIQSFDAEMGDVNAGIMMPDGQQILSVGDGVVKRWEVVTGTCTGTFKGIRAGTTITMSDSQNFAMTAAGSAITVWDLSRDRFSISTLGNGVVLSVACSPDGRHFAAGTEKNNIVFGVINIDTSTTVVHANQPKINNRQPAEKKTVKPVLKTTGHSDVDNNIPQNAKGDNTNTYVLLVGNETYNTEPAVKFAGNDVATMKRYCLETLGIPAGNIKYLENASFGTFMGGITWMRNFAKVSGGKAKLIFYYAGHGMPDEKSKQPFLLPVDGSSEDPATALNLGTILSRLTEIPSERLIVILDACFSGGARDNNNTLLAANTRGVKIKPKESELPPNVILMSAASGEETAIPFMEKEHGLFTYFLLKKLQDSKGTCTLSELADYTAQNVAENAVHITDGKIQSPSVKAGAAFVDTWKDQKLK